MTQQSNHIQYANTQCRECTICMHEKELVKFSIECNHRFCSDCTSQIDKCPLCRREKKRISSYFGNDSHLSRLARLVGI